MNDNTKFMNQRTVDSHHWKRVRYVDRIVNYLVSSYNLSATRASSLCWMALISFRIVASLDYKDISEQLREKLVSLPGSYRGTS